MTQFFSLRGGAATVGSWRGWFTISAFTTLVATCTQAVPSADHIQPAAIPPSGSLQDFKTSSAPQAACDLPRKNANARSPHSLTPRSVFSAYLNVRPRERHACEVRGDAVNARRHLVARFCGHVVAAHPVLTGKLIVLLCSYCAHVVQVGCTRHGAAHKQWRKRCSSPTNAARLQLDQGSHHCKHMKLAYVLLLPMSATRGIASFSCVCLTKRNQSSKSWKLW